MSTKQILAFLALGLLLLGGVHLFARNRYAVAAAATLSIGILGPLHARAAAMICVQAGDYVGLQNALATAANNVPPRPVASPNTVVVRAITDAADPEAAARELSELLGVEVGSAKP